MKSWALAAGESYYAIYKLYKVRFLPPLFRVYHPVIPQQKNIANETAKNYIWCLNTWYILLDEYRLSIDLQRDGDATMSPNFSGT